MIAITESLQRLALWSRVPAPILTRKECLNHGEAHSVGVVDAAERQQPHGYAAPERMVATRPLCWCKVVPPGRTALSLYPTRPGERSRWTGGRPLGLAAFSPRRLPWVSQRSPASRRTSPRCSARSTGGAGAGGG